MKKEIHLFNKKLYQKSKKELNKNKVRKIIQKHNKNLKPQQRYEFEFLSYYYSPLLTTLAQFIGNLKNKQILEIGYRTPLFLDYLKMKGAKTYGIDTKPFITKKNYLKMSIGKLNQKFIKENKDKFDAIIERITLSKLYDKKHFLKTGKHKFKNKEKILSNISQLLQPNGILILQDDRGSIFTKSELSKANFRKIMKEITIKFKDKKGKDIGWNIIVVYKKF